MFHSSQVDADENVVECYEPQPGYDCPSIGMRETILDRLVAIGGVGLDECSQVSITGQIIDATDPNKCCYSLSIDDSQCEGETENEGCCF